MPSALGWSLSRFLQLLRFCVGQINFCLGFAGYLHLHLVWPDKVSGRIFFEFHRLARVPQGDSPEINIVTIFMA